MAFEGLADKLGNAFKKLKSKGKLTESDVKEAMREVRLALLEADVNYKVAKDFTARITERAVGEDVMESLTPAQMVIKIVNEELTALMGGSEERLKMPAHPPAVIMMCGLQGAGKTTHSAKLAKMLKSRGSRPLLVAGDIYRPAAIKQLQVVGAQAGVPVFEMGTEDPVKIAQAAVRHARDYGNDYVIIDTAGRLQIDEASPRPTAIPAAVRHFPLRPSPASPSSSPARAKRLTTSRFSTPTVWQAVSSAWATCCPSSKTHRRKSTKSPRRAPQSA